MTEDNKSHDPFWVDLRLGQYKKRKSCAFRINSESRKIARLRITCIFLQISTERAATRLRTYTRNEALSDAMPVVLSGYYLIVRPEIAISIWERSRGTFFIRASIKPGCALLNAKIRSISAGEK